MQGTDYGKRKTSEIHVLRFCYLQAKHVAMKTSALYGIQFAASSRFKALLLTHFISFNQDGLEADFEQTMLKVTGMAGLFGISPQLIAREIAAGHLFQTPPQMAAIEKAMRSDGCPQYYISSDVQQLCSNLELGGSPHEAWLLKISEGVRQFNLGEFFFRYQKTGRRIDVLAAKNSAGKSHFPEQYAYFSFNTGKNKKVAASSNTIIATNYQDQAAAFEIECRKKFLQLVCFVELAPVTEVIVAAGEYHRAKKQADKLVNEQGFAVTIIGINWNKTNHLQGEIKVAAQLRNQAWGPGYSKRRTILLLPFSYDRYTLVAGKTKFASGGKRK